MRFIHTADWHLGRIFHGVHLTDDQDHVLRQFLDLVRDVRPDAVLIAGDIYDRAVPPPDAVVLLDEVLSKLTELRVPVAMIAGNHDSPDRLGFGARLFESHGLHVSCNLSSQRRPLVLDDAYGRVHIHMLPFADPPQVREHLGDDTVHNHARAMEALIEQARARQPRGERSVLMAHATVVGARTSDSERPLGAFPGTSAIESSKLAGFDYVALGHLHTPQVIDGRIHYPGSPLKYSFGEAEEIKAVSVVEMDALGRVTIDAVPLSPRREVRKVRGHLSDLLANDDGKRREDFVAAVLYDDGAVLDPIGRLREIYPNILHIERLALDLPGAINPPTDHRKRTHLDLFKDFFNEVTGAPLTEDQELAMAALVEGLDREDREVSP